MVRAGAPHPVRPGPIPHERWGRVAVGGPTLLGVSTRVLLVAALLCGIAILVAFTVQVLIAT